MANPAAWRGEARICQRGHHHGTTAEQRRFAVSRSNFVSSSPGATALESAIIPLLEDVGTGLELAFYEEAVTHLIGGEPDVLRDIEVLRGNGAALGTQRLRLSAPATAAEAPP